MLRLHVSSRRCCTAVISATAFSVVAAAPALAAPPNIPSKAAARSELDALVVTTEGSMAGYARELFPHWSTVAGTCNTRETVLKRDGSAVTVDGACYPASGSWYSQYDAATVTSASGVDIDHVVPLAEAWRSGASSWTTSTRQSFANDLSHPQLIAASASSNRSKSDQDPSTWTPRAAYDCTYSKLWIGSKHAWSLRLQPAEKSALEGLLNTCSS
ncbi:MAG: hypothetical protein QOH83_1267 [Solirubrobacteraceae bacterium]|nr:hypothetical protein [Solirubrobacteraceae bacterium]